MVPIANPIYDVVFKYLMNDEKVARLLLSAIIGKEVVSLELRPTERTLSITKELMVLRMDFSARILDKDGNQQLVLIELQKAKLPSDIMRFRRYLGEQYMNSNNVITEVAEQKEAYRKALPILSIYFLGHKLDHIEAPVVRVNRSYIDAATGATIHEKEEFIESLTHDSIIIQIPYLKDNRRTELERLLTLFDQSNKAYDHHLLLIEEEDIPERYQPLLRRLQKAMAEPSVRTTMDDEDDIIEDLKNIRRRIEEKDKLLEAKDGALLEKEKAIEEKEKTIEEKEKTIEEKEKTIEEKEKTIEEKEKTIEEKEKTIEEKENELIQKQQHLKTAVRNLNAAGNTFAQIAAIFGLSEGDVEKLLRQD